MQLHCEISYIDTHSFDVLRKRQSLLLYCFILRSHKPGILDLTSWNLLNFKLSFFTKIASRISTQTGQPWLCSMSQAILVLMTSVQHIIKNRPRKLPFLSAKKSLTWPLVSQREMVASIFRLCWDPSSECIWRIEHVRTN